MRVRDTTCRPPTDMAESTWALIARLPCGVRDRVLERSCLLHYEAGVPVAEADERAYLEEVGS